MNRQLVAIRPDCDGLLLIAEGLAEILIEDDCRMKPVVGLRNRHDFFGATVVLSGQRYPGSSRTVEPLTCLCLHRKDLETLIHRFPEFSRFFNTLLAERMRLLYERNLADRSCLVSSTGATLLFQDQVSRVMSTPC